VADCCLSKTVSHFILTVAGSRSSPNTMACPVVIHSCQPIQLLPPNALAPPPRALDPHGPLHTRSVPTPEDHLVPLPFTPGSSILKSFNALPLRRTTRCSFLPFTPGFACSCTVLSTGSLLVLVVFSCGPMSIATAMDYRFVRFIHVVPVARCNYHGLFVHLSCSRGFFLSTRLDSHGLYSVISFHLA
jgi:hypothetical protein